jgi:MoxR-like ATPase
MEVSEIRRHTEAVLGAVGEQMFGLGRVVRFALVALYSSGHVLLEGNPGVGKTELIKTMAGVLNLNWGRIQFTPDLMPADITGTLMPDEHGRLEFKPGPIFTSLLLADEINRATPKTQSAMLEAMAEQNVTVLGVTWKLPSPFMVMATQNPIDQEGTYNLPEAQSDRFMFKVSVPAPGDRDVLSQIMAKRAGALAKAAPARRTEPSTASLPDRPVSAAALTDAIRERIRHIQPVDALEAHITNLYMATNRYFDSLDRAMGNRKDVETLARKFQFGISPRAVGEIMLASKAWACLFGADTMDASAPDLASVVQSALRHRLRLSLDAELGNDSSSTIQTPQEAVDRLILELCVLTAPRYSNYHEFWTQRSKEWKL